jgi:predicted O-methyltransferase YrrM
MTIGAVVVSRNDNYGGNLKERATLCINSLINSVDEIIYVDWNSENNSLISEIRKDLIQSEKLKWIIISPQKAKELLNNKASQSCVEVLGRNIGIRRLTTDFILSTNIDVIIPKREYLESLNLENIFYIGARRNIPLDSVGNYDKMLSYPQVGDSGAYVGDIWSKVDCCGDFQYAHKNVWYSIKGFEESLIGRGFSDSNIQKKAALAGFELKVVRDILVFHINHGGGFGGNGIVNSCDLALRNFTTSTNKDTWGFSNLDFNLYTLKDKTDMQFPNIDSLFEKNKKTNSDINEHLQFLYDLIKLTNSKIIIELGTRSGNSTSAFLSALDKDGLLWSCDLNNPQGEIASFVEFPNWEFHLGNDLSKEILKKLPKEYDIVFIDTGHFFKETLLEMEEYYKKLKPGGIMLLHDSNEPGFMEEFAAIMVFLDRHKDADFYNFMHNHGMAVISKGSSFTPEVKNLFK